jgi:hypothetical protein
MPSDLIETAMGYACYVRDTPDASRRPQAARKSE